MDSSQKIYGVTFLDLKEKKYSYTIGNVNDELMKKIVEKFKGDTDYRVYLLDHPAKFGRNPMLSVF